MIYTCPDYYRKFKCISNKCPLSCCEGWEIEIDNNSIKNYKQIEGSFGNRVKSSINWNEGTFKQSNKRCAFLNDKNLCDIYIEKGEDMLCDTCKTYPRHIEVFDDEMESSLFLSCPVAAELILGNIDKVNFITTIDDKEDIIDEDFDILFYSPLKESRSLIINILQNRKENIYIRMIKVLILAKEVQKLIDSNNIFEIEVFLDKYKKNEIASRYLNKAISEYRCYENTFPSKLLSLLFELEVLDENWTGDLECWEEILSNKEILREYKNTVTEVELEQMMVYYVFSYYCMAVYDNDALSKIKMAIVNTLLWEFMCFGEYVRQRNKESNLNRKFITESLEKNERQKIAYRYSRELEHSDLNIKKIEELMRERKAADTESLLNILIKKSI